MSSGRRAAKQPEQLPRRRHRPARRGSRRMTSRRRAGVASERRPGPGRRSARCWSASPTLLPFKIMVSAAVPTHTHLLLMRSGQGIQVLRQPDLAANPRHDAQTVDAHALHNVPLRSVGLMLAEIAKTHRQRLRSMGYLAMLSTFASSRVLPHTPLEGPGRSIAARYPYGLRMRHIHAVVFHCQRKHLLQRQLLPFCPRRRKRHRT
jgi:hypothetical protein